MFVYKCLHLTLGHFYNYFNISECNEITLRNKTINLPCVEKLSKLGEINCKYSGVYEWLQLPSNVIDHISFPKPFRLNVLILT